MSIIHYSSKATLTMQKIILKSKDALCIMAIIILDVSIVDKILNDDV